MTKKLKITAIFIAYNAAGTLEKFYQQFPKGLVDEIILVDDSSKDNTFQLAKRLKIKSFQNPTNLGYGGNLKRSLSIALRDKADIIIDIHPDGEYKPYAIPLALKKINEGAEFVLGNRFPTYLQPLKSGMNYWKIIPMIVLNKIDGIILGIDLKDFHQGFRVYTKSMLEKMNFEYNANNYLFSFELIAQAVFLKVRISEVPVETNYTGKKRGANIKNSIKYSLGTFKVLFLFILAKLGYKTKIFQEPKYNLATRISRINQSLS